MPHVIHSLAELFKEAERHVERPLVILDIDETILRSPTFRGSEAWYDSLIERNRGNGMSERDATLAANAEWEQAHESIDPLPADPDVSKLLAAWQRRHPALGLTTRSAGFAGHTRRQLSLLGLSLSGLPGLANPRFEQEHSGYEAGVLYVGPLGDKGSLFEALLVQSAWRPTFVAFADDRPGNVLSMEGALARLGIVGFVARFIRRAEA